MDRKKRIGFIILVLLFISLFIFIIRMQSDFVNTDLSAETTLQLEDEEPNTTSHSKIEEKKEEKEEDFDQEDEIEEDLPSTMFVIADQLNVRRGPGSDHPIDGMVSHNQEVQVEEVEEEWVKISIDDLTGYVNIEFLAEEADE